LDIINTDEKITDVRTQREFKSFEYIELKNMIRILVKNDYARIAVIPSTYSEFNCMYYSFLLFNKPSITDKVLSSNKIVQYIIEQNNLEDMDVSLMKINNSNSRKYLDDFDGDTLNIMYEKIPANNYEEYHYKNDRIIKDIIDFYEIKNDKDYSKLGKYIDSIFPRCIEEKVYLSQLIIALLTNFHDIDKMNQTSVSRVSYGDIIKGNYDFGDIQNIFIEYPLEYKMLQDIYQALPTVE